jgi:NitT/TauT family transport system substrate-binding protein
MKLFPKLLAACLSIAILPGVALAKDVPIRFILDWKIQGPHAWFYVAKEKGYFAAEGLDVTIDQGDGSAAAVTRIMSGVYDAGFGDINASIQMASQQPGKSPVMVSLLYNRAPFAIISKASGPIKTLKDLEGHTVATPTGSATFKLFPALAAKNGVDAAKVKVMNATPSLIEQLLVRGDADAIAQFGPTSYMNFVAMGLDPDKDFRWFFYSDLGVDMYSNGVMVSPKLIKENPQAVRGLVRAIHHAINDVVADPDMGIAVIKKYEPLTDSKVEKERLIYTIKQQLRTAETNELGLGDLKDSRLSASIDSIAQVYELTSKPALRDVFDRSFLPPKAERMLPATNY